jgi:hypothetical protein
MDLNNTIFQQIQQNLDALQKQLDTMKTEPILELPNLQGSLHEQFKEKSNELLQIMKEMIKESGICMSAVFSVGGEEYGGLSETVFCSVDNIEKIDESKISAAVEAFSSPKRIAIIKALIAKKFLSSNELTMKTGCIGGQLYHHLSNLEAAQIVCKSNEMYTLTDSGRNIINGILGIVFGEKI